MPQASTIVINDGAASPVAHTFTPIGKDSKGVLWYEQTTPSPTNPLGAKRIGYKQVRALDSGNRLSAAGKAVFTLHLPTLESLGTNDAGLTPPPTLAYKQVARVEIDLPERGATQERKDTRVLLLNLLGHASAVAAIDTLQPIYS
jgi:hypothetical protein